MGCISIVYNVWHLLNIFAVTYLSVLLWIDRNKGDNFMICENFFVTL